MESKTETETVVPVFEERAAIDTRSVVTDRVIVRTAVETRNEVIERSLRNDEIRVDRVSIGRVVLTVPDTREEDGVLIVPVVEEELVVRTQLVLKEELHIRRIPGTRTKRRDVLLRREVVSVDHLAGAKKFEGE